MENQFNGQINISRDLRKNKQVFIGKFDLTDIIFLTFGFSAVVIVSYILGFSPIRIMDEFFAIVISIFPMALILSFGFRRIAGIRQFNYLRMKRIDKKNNNRILINIDEQSIGDKYLISFEIDNEKVDYYKNKFLEIENLKRLQIRYEKDKVIFILDLRYKKEDSIFLDILNKNFKQEEFKRIPVEEIYILEAIKNYIFINKNTESKKINNKNIINELINNLKSVLNIDNKENKNLIKNKKLIEIPKESYISIKYEKYSHIKNTILKQCLINIRLLLLKLEYAIYYFTKYVILKYKQFKQRNNKFINVDNIMKFLNDDIKTRNMDIATFNKHKVYMLKLYNKDIYDDFVKEIKDYADVICYFKKVNNKIYVDTYLIIEDDVETIKTIDCILNRYCVVVDKLSKNQNLGTNSVSYLMTNQLNNYKEYI